VSNYEVVLIPADKCCSCGLERTSRGASQSHRLLKNKQASIYWTLDLEEAEKHRGGWPWTYKYIQKKFIVDNRNFNSCNSEPGTCEIFLKLDGKIVSEEALERAADDLKNASQPWFCQRCANKVCDLCGWSTIYPGPCEVIDDAGRRVEIEKLSLKPGCFNPDCENSQDIVEEFPTGSEHTEYKPGAVRYEKTLKDKDCGYTVDLSDREVQYRNLVNCLKTCIDREVPDIVSMCRIDSDETSHLFDEFRKNSFIIISGWDTLNEDDQIFSSQPEHSWTLGQKFKHHRNLAVHFEIAWRCSRVGIDTSLLTGYWLEPKSTEQRAREDALLLIQPTWFRREDFLVIGAQILKDFDQRSFLYYESSESGDHILYQVDRNRECTVLEMGTGALEKAYPMIRSRHDTPFRFSGTPLPSCLTGLIECLDWDILMNSWSL